MTLDPGESRRVRGHDAVTGCPPLLAVIVLLRGPLVTGDENKDFLRKVVIVIDVRIASLDFSVCHEGHLVLVPLGGIFKEWNLGVFMVVDSKPNDSPSETKG